MLQRSPLPWVAGFDQTFNFERIRTNMQFKESCPEPRRRRMFPKFQLPEYLTNNST